MTAILEVTKDIFYGLHRMFIFGKRLFFKYKRRVNFIDILYLITYYFLSVGCFVYQEQEREVKEFMPVKKKATKKKVAAKKTVKKKTAKKKK